MALFYKVFKFILHLKPGFYASLQERTHVQYVPQFTWLKYVVPWAYQIKRYTSCCILFSNRFLIRPFPPLPPASSVAIARWMPSTD